MILSTYIQLINIDPSTFSLNIFKRNSLKLSFSVNLSEYSPFDETIILEPTRGKVFYVAIQNESSYIDIIIF